MAAATVFKPSRFLYLGPFVTMADRFSVAPMLIPIALSLHVTLAAVAAIATVYYLAYGLLPPLYGALSDRFGRVRIIRGALAGMAIADLLSALAPNLTFLLVARFLTGAIACGVLPTSLVYLGDSVAFRVRQRAVADLLAWVAVGTAAGTLGAGLIAHLASWRVAFLIPAAVAAGLALLLGRLPESHNSRRGPGPVQQFRQVLRHRWALIVLGLGLCEGAVMIGLITYFPSALEAHGQSSAIAGGVAATYGAAALAGTQAFKGLAGRTPAPLLLATGGAMLSIGFLLAAINQGLLAILAASMLAGGAYAFMHSTFQTWATEVAPEARGTGTSLFAMAIFTGAAVATGGGAGLAGARHYGLLFLIAGGLAIPVTVAGAFARWRYAAAGLRTDARRTG